MNGKKETKLMKDCLKKWGEVSQIDILIEEMGELIAELQRLKRINRGDWEKVLHEYGDVTFCLKQLRLILGEHGITSEMIKSRRIKNQTRLLNHFLNYLSQNSERNVK